jgi:HAD superfamily hydrolase (TIGR01509 family)
MVQAIIFDCFGVLATEAWLPFKAKYFGHDPELFEQASAIAKQANRGLIGSGDFIAAVAELAGVNPAEAVQAIARNVPNEPLFAYIKELKADYKLGFLSNISADRLSRIFTPGQLALFDAMALSFETGFIKPERAAFQDIAERLGTDIADCVLVDDQQRNVAGARRAGMPAVLYSDVPNLKAELSKLFKA